MTIPTPDLAIFDFEAAALTEQGSIVYVEGVNGENTAVRMDGVGTALLESSAIITSNAAFTVAGFVKSNGAQPATHVSYVNQYHPTNTNLRMFTLTNQSNDKLRLHIRSGGTTQRSTLGDTAVGDDEWHYVIATFEDKGSLNEMRIQVDGVISAYDELDVNANAGNMNTSSEVLRFGYDRLFGHFKGDMDRWQIWNSFLTLAQQAELAASELLILNPISGQRNRGARGELLLGGRR